MFKKTLIGLGILLGLYAVLWFGKLAMCKAEIVFESCVWNLLKYGLPFPKCVCVG